MNEIQNSGSTPPAVNDVLLAMAEELKHQIIELDVSSSMNDQFNLGPARGLTKLEVAKLMLREEANRRSAIGPLFGLCAFTYGSVALAALGCPLPEMLSAIESLEAHGGTAIAAAVIDGLTRLEADPSPAAVNHLIIVTDAEDKYSEWQAQEHVSQAVQREIIIDVILICRPGGVRLPEAEQGLRVLSEKTQGRFVKVTDAEGLKTAFRGVASRSILLLEA